MGKNEVEDLNLIELCKILKSLPWFYSELNIYACRILLIPELWHFILVLVTNTTAS